MKKIKSPVNTVITPTKKGLKQARLPFKPISDVSPKPASQGRKRKLSEPEGEAVTKISKISKENDDVDINDTEVVVLSDDDNLDHSVSHKNEKKFNPYVKLVDTVLKNKAQKNKNHKKLATGRNTSKLSSGVENKIEASDNETQGDTKVILNKDMTGRDDKHEKFQHIKDSPLKINNDEQTLDDEKDDKNITVLAPPSIIVTPKRSSRKKAKVEDKLDSSSSSSKMDESIPSAPTTPRQSRSSSVTKTQGDDSLNLSNGTPKQVQKKFESAKKKEEREKERHEREKVKHQEKEERAKQKQEKEEQKKREREEKEEAKKREKEEKEEQKRKEKEEKDKQRELEKKQKEEKEEQKRKEKEEKELQKRKEKEAKEEEKRKKQEALELERQEQELKKKKAAEAFVNFFVPKQKVDKNQKAIETSKNSMLSTFTIKADMRLAPTTRHSLSDDSKKKLDVFIGEQNLSLSKLYLQAVKKGILKPLVSGRTWPLSDKDDDDDVMIIEDELPPLDGVDALITCEPVVRENLHPKLLSFHENRRPPYYGTWRKKSSIVKPRRPFGQDDKLLDYECDSDEEWEEEQEGESIDGSAAGSEDEQEADEYEVDNEVFVPHGYLSDEEATLDEDDVLSLSPETQKQKLKHLEKEFESELKKPTEKLKPRLYGLLWATTDGGKPDNCVDILWNYFDKLSMIMNDPIQLMQPSANSEELEKKKVKKKKTKIEGETKQISPKQEKKKKASTENKELKRPKTEKKVINDVKKNQPGINSFLNKFKPS